MPPRSGEHVVTEARDHLTDAAAEEGIEDQEEAERRAVARFGDPRELAARFAAISLAKQTKRIAVIIVLAIVTIMVMMKARVAWYGFVQWTIRDEARAAAGLVLTVNRYAFWIAAATGIGALFYIGWRSTPTRVHAGYRRHLRRAAFLFVGATAALAASVMGDLILMVFRAGMELSAEAVIPIASLSIEVASIATVIFMIASASRRRARMVRLFGAELGPG
jgi:hypothetical protein